MFNYWNDVNVDLFVHLLLGVNWSRKGISMPESLPSSLIYKTFVFWIKVIVITPCLYDFYRRFDSMYMWMNIDDESHLFYLL